MGRVFCRMPPGPVVIIGADIPGILPRHLEDAFAALGRADVAVGPAPDGKAFAIPPTTVQAPVRVDIAERTRSQWA